MYALEVGKYVGERVYESSIICRCYQVYCLRYEELMFTLIIFFFFNDTATTEIYTLSLHDALPICPVLAAAAPLIFILTNSCWCSAPAFYTAHFLLRQRPRFLYLPILAAAAFYSAHFS